MTTGDLIQCPKCEGYHGNDWSQCGGSCPMPMSPHYNPPAHAREAGAQEPVAWLGPYKDAATALNELRKSVAEIIGADPETWPDHGNAPLAIASTVALAHRTHPAPAQEPVASYERCPDCNGSGMLWTGEDVKPCPECKGNTVAPAQEPVAVPAGFVLVPVKPTRAMLDAGTGAVEPDYGMFAVGEGDAAAIWEAMLAAAPVSPAAESGVGEIKKVLERALEVACSAIAFSRRDAGTDRASDTLYELGSACIPLSEAIRAALDSTPAPQPGGSWFAEDVRRASERQAEFDAERPRARVAAPQPGAVCPPCNGTGQRQDKRTGKNYPCPRCEAPQPGGAGCPHCSGTGKRQDKRTGKSYPCPRCEPSPSQWNAGAKLKELADELCEGWCKENGGEGKFDDCLGCRILSALPTQAGEG